MVNFLRLAQWQFLKLLPPSLRIDSHGKTNVRQISSWKLNQMEQLIPSREGWLHKKKG